MFILGILKYEQQINLHNWTNVKNDIDNKYRTQILLALSTSVLLPDVPTVG